jgi:tRNA threonylcarbamoyladenosine biosynthesis protein TsaB
LRLLALDTATENCSAALRIGGQLLTRELESERGHAEHILPMIDALLAEADLTLAALDAIAFGRGPGSFTGVRLAASITQGLAFGAGLGVVAVSDLRALAQRAFDLDPHGGRVLVCSDARMGEVYWAAYTRSAGLAEPAGPERVDAPQRLARCPAGTVGAGRGFAAYPQLAAQTGTTVPSGWQRLLPRAADIARLAEPEVRLGRLLAPEQAVPIYVRDTVARPSSL